MEPFIGQIILFAGNFAPRGWAECDGQLLDISSHSALFSILGTTYGGDGRTTFALPDLRGRVAVHEGNGPGLPPVSLGEKAGNATTTLSVNNLPSHTHTATVTTALTLMAAAANGEEEEAGDNSLGTATIYADADPSEAMRSGSISGDVNVTNLNTGNGTSFSNQPPFLGLTYIIALVGTYPSRN